MAQGKDPEKGGEQRKIREPGKRKEAGCIQKRVHSLGPQGENKQISFSKYWIKLGSSSRKLPFQVAASRSPITTLHRELSTRKGT
jgi:hypothetical protein